MIVAAHDESMRIKLEDMLQLGGIDFVFAMVVEAEERFDNRALDDAAAVVLQIERLGVRIGQVKLVLDAARQKQRVRAGRPGAMIAQVNVWFL